MENDSKSRQYNKIKIRSEIWGSVLGFVLLIIFLKTPASRSLESLLLPFFPGCYPRLLAYAGVIWLFSKIVYFPLNFYTDYLLEHKYGLSNQSLGRYFLEDLKADALGLCLLAPLLAGFYYIFLSFGNAWWLPFSILMFTLSILLSSLAPVLILPLFYKISPIEDEILKAQVSDLAREAGLRLDNLYRFDMSKNTKKSNAMFTGLGKTKRVIIGDNLLENFSREEIVSVIAHEFGHHKKGHLYKNIIMSGIMSFCTFFFIAILYRGTLGYFGDYQFQAISSLPLILLWALIIGLIETPIFNSVSRMFEYEADLYSVRATGNKDVYARALAKLSRINLAETEPNPFVEWFFYSHPSIKKRIGAILDS